MCQLTEQDEMKIISRNTVYRPHDLIEKGKYDYAMDPYAKEISFEGHKLYTAESWDEGAYLVQGKYVEHGRKYFQFADSGRYYTFDMGSRPL